MDLETVRELWAELDPALKAYKDEARTLSDELVLPELTDSVAQLQAQLVSAQRAQWRLNGILADLGLIRSRLRKLVSELQAVYEDKFAANVLAERAGEFMSGKAQDAKYAAGALDEKVRLRRGKSMLADAEEIYDFVDQKLRGIGSYRRDVDTRTRLLTYDR